MTKTIAHRSPSESGDSQRLISIQALATVAMLSLLVTVAVVHRLNVKAILVFLAVFITSGGLWMLFKTFLAKGSGNSSALEREEVIMAQVAMIPAEAAKTQAEALLKDKTKFLCEQGMSADFPSATALPPLILEFFGKYGRVAVINGDGVIDRSQVSPSQHLRSGFRIGHDIADSELVVEGSSDIIFETDGTENSRAEMRQYPTIWHWIIAQNRFIYSE